MEDWYRNSQYTTFLYQKYPLASAAELGQRLAQRMLASPEEDLEDICTSYLYDQYGNMQPFVVELVLIWLEAVMIIFQDKPDTLRHMFETLVLLVDRSMLLAETVIERDIRKGGEMESSLFELFKNSLACCKKVYRYACKQPILRGFLEEIFEQADQELETESWTTTTNFSDYMLLIAFVSKNEENEYFQTIRNLECLVNYEPDNDWSIIKTRKNLDIIFSILNKKRFKNTKRAR